MSAHAIPARAMGDFIGGDPPQPPRPDYEYDECECGERKRAEARFCRACWNRYQRAMHHEANVPEMLERRNRYEFALEMGYTEQELSALCRHSVGAMRCRRMRNWRASIRESICGCGGHGRGLRQGRGRRGDGE